MAKKAKKWPKLTLLDPNWPFSGWNHIFWPKNVPKSRFLTQKCPQMTMFYPKIRQFKKTTLQFIFIFFGAETMIPLTHSDNFIVTVNNHILIFRNHLSYCFIVMSCMCPSAAVTPWVSGLISFTRKVSRSLAIYAENIIRCSQSPV